MFISSPATFRIQQNLSAETHMSLQYRARSRESLTDRPCAYSAEDAIQSILKGATDNERFKYTASSRRYSSAYSALRHTPVYFTAPVFFFSNKWSCSSIRPFLIATRQAEKLWNKYMYLFFIRSDVCDTVTTEELPMNVWENSLWPPYA